MVPGGVQTSEVPRVAAKPGNNMTPNNKVRLSKTYEKQINSQKTKENLEKLKGNINKSVFKGNTELQKLYNAKMKSIENAVKAAEEAEAVRVAAEKALAERDVAKENAARATEEAEAARAAAEAVAKQAKSNANARVAAEAAEAEKKVAEAKAKAEAEAEAKAKAEAAEAEKKAAEENATAEAILKAEIKKKIRKKFSSPDITNNEIDEIIKILISNKIKSANQLNNDNFIKQTINRIKNNNQKALYQYKLFGTQKNLTELTNLYGKITDSNGKIKIKKLILSKIKSLSDFNKLPKNLKKNKEFINKQQSLNPTLKNFTKNTNTTGINTQELAKKFANEVKKNPRLFSKTAILPQNVLNNNNLLRNLSKLAKYKSGSAQFGRNQSTGRNRDGLRNLRSFIGKYGHEVWALNMIKEIENLKKPNWQETDPRQPRRLTKEALNELESNKRMVNNNVASTTPSTVSTTSSYKREELKQARQRAAKIQREKKEMEKRKQEAERLKEFEKKQREIARQKAIRNTAAAKRRTRLPGQIVPN